MVDFVEPIFSHMLRARYDTNGNIILAETKVAAAETVQRETAMNVERKEIHATDESSGSRIHRSGNRAGWTDVDDHPVAPKQHNITPKKHTMHQTPTTTPPTKPQRSRITDPPLVLRSSKSKGGSPITDPRSPIPPSVLSSAVKEGRKQLSETIDDAQSEYRSIVETFSSLPKRANGLLRRFWAAANTPVMLPGKKTKRKPPTKIRLFITDTIRFGGTFALIFGVLFVGINAQSFWQIARAQLALGTDATTEQALTDMTSEKIDDNPLLLRRPTAGLLAFLPAVGPFEDRLIIPKIGKNVPIVRPGMDALMKEDWKQFELDIQSALKRGAVHYPGSAKPGLAGNFFLTAHSSYYFWDDGRFKDTFARLGELNPGDTYMVYYGGDRHTYRVTGKKEVKPSDVSVLDQPTDKRLATLMTCTPVGTTLHRLIVSAEEIDPVTNDILKVGEKMTEPEHSLFGGLEALPI